MSLLALNSSAALSLKAPGFARPLRLSWMRRRGALETFAVDGEALEATRFAPTGVVREQGGRLVATPEAAEAYAEAAEAFATLGRRLQTLQPLATPAVTEVVRGPQGCFWLHAPTGLTLEAWLADHPGPVDPAVAAAFARRLGGALAELHAGGVVHGDLSPGAVVIDDEAVRLVGFGVERRPFYRVLRSQYGLVEPGYAPPEAHDGARRRPIGPAADIYAASALLLRLLTGEAPPPANAAAHLSGDDPWRGTPPQDGLRKGVETGLALTPEARPASAVAWLAGLELPPEAADEPWFAGAVRRPLALSEPFDIPPPPSAAVDLAPDADEPPLAFEPGEPGPARRGRGRNRTLAVAGLTLAAGAAAAAALMWLPPSRPAAPPPTPQPAPAPAPPAPDGCQWLAASGGAWRLRCADETAGLRLPDRFDAQTTSRAAAGEVAAMERLGAFYRQRASTAAPANRGAHAYQAYAWLGRAADAAANSRPEEQRARDDAALALGQMLAKGEGGRAVDPAGAEARLRHAAAGSRADAVLALAQFLEAQRQPDRVTEARGLYARVAQLQDGSALQREAAAALVRIDAARAAAAAPSPAPAPQPTPQPKPAPPPPPAPAPARPPASAPAAKTPPAKAAPTPAPTAQPPAPRRPAAPPAAATPPRPRTPSPAPAPRAQAGTPFGARTWTSFTFLQVDPAANFYPQVELAGRAACAREGGYAVAVRNGDVVCPNGVNYCQVRAIATCQSQ